jgi:alkanesulfonate monooxygenase SsuD/methylene tetrahydromethanopterin reductase-like flavin-dependent oxidoreductase (luciferase family)
MTRPFRFGLQAFEASSGSAWTETARRAEALGYCTLFTTDHHFGPGEISTSSGHRPVDVAPISAMTMAAAVTTTLRVGCRVFCVDYHQPVVLAKELATVDFLTDGRVEAAFGAGWVAAEYEGLGIPMDTAACASPASPNGSSWCAPSGAVTRSRSTVNTCMPPGSWVPRCRFKNRSPS